MIEDSMAKTCKLYLPVVRTLEITKIIDFNQADYLGIVFVYLFFGSEFRLVNYFDSEIVRSLSAYFGKTRSEIGYTTSETFMSFKMADSSQFSPLTTLSEQLGPNSWVSSVFIPAFIANIGKYFFRKYDYQNSKSI